MRFGSGLVLLALSVTLLSSARGEEPTPRQLLEAFEQQAKICADTAGPSIACIVVSRSELYPKVAGNGEVTGKLGAFDSKEFLKNDWSPERMKLAQSLDLADVQAIPNHGYVGGVVIDPTGLILTPYHAIEGATKIYVFLPGGSGSYADVHAADARSDLAVLKLITPPAKLKAIKFADVRISPLGGRKATVFTGKLVALLVNPYTSGFTLKPSAAFGSITNVRYRVPDPPDSKRGDFLKSDSSYKFGLLLEHNVKMNAAVTGGVLVNLDGEMVGLTTATAVVHNRELGPGFAIPIDDNFRRIVEVLRRGEEVEYGFLGVQLVPSAEEILIQQLTPRGPASMAGLVAGDSVAQIDHVPAENYEDLLLYGGCALAGAKIKLTLAPRGGQRREVELTLGKFRHSQPFIASVRPEPVFGLRVDWGSILAQQQPQNVDPRVAASGVPPGVCVRETIANSPAATKFKALGDNPTRWLISHVNGLEVNTPSEFYKAAKGQQSVKLTLIDPSEINPRPRELTLP